MLPSTCFGTNAGYVYISLPSWLVHHFPFLRTALPALTQLTTFKPRLDNSTIRPLRPLHIPRLHVLSFSHYPPPTFTYDPTSPSCRPSCSPGLLAQVCYRRSNKHTPTLLCSKHANDLHAYPVRIVQHKPGRWNIQYPHHSTTPNRTLTNPYFPHTPSHFPPFFPPLWKVV